MRVVVDGMNVVGARPDGWWRDRDAAVRALAGRLGQMVRATGAEVAVVFDGRPPAGLDEGLHAGVAVRYARRGGRDAADDRIVEDLQADPERAGVVVVTSDRDLRDRVHALGAGIKGTGEFLTWLDSVATVPTAGSL